jgi:hypothetical protein
MRFNAFIQTLLPIALRLGFVAVGIVASIRVGDSQQQFESRLQSIRDRMDGH